MNYLKLKGIVPDSVFDELPACIDKFDINTELRLAHFLAQCAHESGNFKRVEESLNYSAERLLVIFPKYFDRDKAVKYARNPRAIANIVYANRMGNDAFGDGWLYRGRGYIQLTGKNNYSAFAKTVSDDILRNPDLVATKYPLVSAAFFWQSKNCNEAADADRISLVTKLVNGGAHGLEERKKYFENYYTLIGVEVI